MGIKPSGVDVHVESRARDEARWLMRDHGDEAEDVLRAKIRNDKKSDADRYRYRLTLREIVRLRRMEPERYGPGKPQGLVARLMSLFP